MVKIDNRSAVDVAGSTVRVSLLLGCLSKLTVVEVLVFIQLIRVIKLYGKDRTREEEDMSAHTLYDTVIEMNYDGCAKNNTSTK